MFNSKKRKELRMIAEGEIISNESYNLIIGAILTYGFVMNAVLVSVAHSFFAGINPLALLIGYFASVIGGSLLVTHSRKPLLSFLGYNLIAVPIGALLSVCLPGYPVDHILSAVVVTAIITVAMMLFGSIFPQFFAKLGLALFLALVVGVIAEVIASMLGYGGDLFNWLFVVIFSLYIGYDWHKAQAYPKTVDNAIDSAVDLYLDIINIFVRLLDIFRKK